MVTLINLNQITLKELPDEQKEIAECIGIESYRKLVEHFGGSRIYVQKADSILKIIRDKRIFQMFNGNNYRHLALIFGLSENRIRYIINQHK